MDSETMSSLLLLLAQGMMGFLTMKAAEMRDAKGWPVLWFIGGAIVPIVALPAAVIKLDPKRKLDRVLLTFIDLDLKRYQKCAEFVKKVAVQSDPILRDLESRLTTWINAARTKVTVASHLERFCHRAVPQSSNGADDHRASIP